MEKESLIQYFEAESRLNYEGGSYSERAAFEIGAMVGYQKAQQEAKIIEGMKIDEYLATKDLTRKDSSMALIEIYNIAIGTASFGEFKAFINKHYNGTPETVVDFSEYVLTKKQK